MFLEYLRNIAKNDGMNHQSNITWKHLMKYFDNNNVLFPVTLKNYSSIFQETFLKYFCNILGKDKVIYYRKVTEKSFMKYD